MVKSNMNRVLKSCLTVLAGLMLAGPMVAGCGSPKTQKRVVIPQEKETLNAGFAKLETVLKEKVLFIHSKLGEPAGEKDIAELREGLGGVEVQCLELWYKWHNGSADNLTDILPLGKMLSISESLEDRELIQKVPFVDPKRKRAIKILEDPAGDGFFLDISGSSPRVFHHMLEDPFPRDYGTLEDFVGFIAEVHSSGVASMTENGIVDFDLEKYGKIESDYLSKLTSP